MARIDLTMPKMGESVAEATLVKWCKNIGDRVEMDETILEIATDKVDSEVPSPKSGILVEKLFKEEDIVLVGSVFGILETDIQANPSSVPQNGTEKANPEPAQEEIHEHILESLPGMNILSSESQDKKIIPFSSISPAEKELGSGPDSSNTGTEDRFYSPLVREIAKKEGLNKKDLDQIVGSGMEGRVTKNDILNFIQNRQNTNLTTETPVDSQKGSDLKSLIEEIPLDLDKGLLTEVSKVQASIPGIDPAMNPGIDSIKPMDGDEIIVMDRMRRLISEHMIMSKNVSAHVTSFVEADVTNLVNWREKNKKDFLAREKENITYTPIFIEAVAKVLKMLPMVNVSVQGNSILVHKHIHIGMATALPNGNLIVPVIKDADCMSLVGLAKKVNDLAGRARNGKLQPDDTTGGTFTITNVGTFGNLMGTPIINQPQVAILATGAIVKKPAVLETEYGDIIAIRQKIFLSLSYDHRVVDGALGGTFLRKVADELESFDPNRTF